MWYRRTAAQKRLDVKYLLTHNWSRLVSTAGCWFFWDFGFYGNKVFQSEFIHTITGGSAPRPWSGNPQPALLSCRHKASYSECGALQAARRARQEGGAQLTEVPTQSRRAGLRVS